ncbi:MAG TPA: hypothetical protein VFZ16_22490 [Hyphomicrobiaceae bacterium]|nr:hypothetical protein [Hyphomicrobiaceae bacterium]
MDGTVLKASVKLAAVVEQARRTPVNALLQRYAACYGGPGVVDRHCGRQGFARPL